MFFDDNRTAAERRRDLERAGRRQANGVLARGFLETCVRPLLVKAKLDVGLTGSSDFGDGGELLAEVDGVVYKLTARVDHDD